MMRWHNGYLLVPRTRPVAGAQDARVAQPMRQATCEEVQCEWFLHGKEGEDYNHKSGRVEPFVHPAGVECGDFVRCWHPNCPCPARKPSHRVPLDSLPLIHKIATPEQTRLVEPTEWVDRVREGFYAREQLYKRGW